MANEKHFTSKTLCRCGMLMTLSALLMAIGTGMMYGILCGVSAFCLFFAALSFYYMENKNESEEIKDE